MDRKCQASVVLCSLPFLGGLAFVGCAPLFVTYDSRPPGAQLYALDDANQPQWGDLDVAAAFLTVRRNVVAGKLTTPRTAKSGRVDLSAKLVETLERRLTAARRPRLPASRRRKLACV